MSSQLWPDERMKKRADELDSELYGLHGGNTRPWQHYMEVWQTIAYEMRDEYQARIAELQALVDEYARRVTVQDTEIAMLRQREEMR